MSASLRWYLIGATLGLAAGYALGQMLRPCSCGDDLDAELVELIEREA